MQRAAMTGIRRYEPLRSKHGFRHRAAQVRVADVRIVASASTPLAVEADGSAETTLLVPFHGWGTSLVDGREHRWQAGNSAMFLPGSARTGKSGVRSVVAITLDPRRLDATARSMVAPRGGGRLDLGLTAPRLVPIAAAHSPGLALLRQILPLLDHAGGEERNLRMLGLDDTNHRAVALLLAPKQLAWSGGSSCSSASPYARRFGESPSETLQKRGRGFEVRGTKAHGCPCAKRIKAADSSLLSPDSSLCRPSVLSRPIGLVEGIRSR